MTAADRIVNYSILVSLGLFVMFFVGTLLIGGPTYAHNQQLMVWHEGKFQYRFDKEGNEVIKLPETSIEDIDAPS